MAILTEKEREALILLVKDINAYYNANSLSKKLEITPVGVHKILNRFIEEGLTEMKIIGKSKIHKPRIDDEYKKKLLAFLLADEANKYKRWKEEFKELFKKDRIVLMYGSAIKNYKSASDIDVMVVIKRGEENEVDNVIDKLSKILPKKIHCIKLTKNDLKNNIKEENKAMVDIIKNAIVLHGYDEYVEVMKDVTSFKSG